MKREEVHAAWAPDGAAWSSWVKPVLFACLAEDVQPDPSPSAAPWPGVELLAPLGALADVAVVVDLPQADGVWAGVALGTHGFRPIPLYNALPHVGAFVDLQPISRALVDASERVAQLPRDAPPAFLLDALRLTVRLHHAGSEHLYDNRSVVRATDFPSVLRLQERGIRRILLIQRHETRHQLDLEPILLGWQRGGLSLWRLVEGSSLAAAPYVFRRLAWYDRLAEWLQRPTLSRRSDGTYGQFWVQGG